MTETLLTIALRFGVLSLFAIGGGVSILIPQLHEEVVRQYHWVDDRAFAELIAISQASPGPNFLLIPLIGWRVASWPGAFVGLVAFMSIPLVLSVTVGRILHDRENETIALLRRAFRPLTGGMWIASGIVVARTVDHAVADVVVTIIVAACAIFVEANPLWWCVGAGVLGALIG
ncbi:MAG TPA: chromate transporter [Candidatus Binatia bacterium]|nr:chromate transporter [Candidatus Binatia bacterium]